MTPVPVESVWRRVRRVVLAFGAGLTLTLGVVWASHQGDDDRSEGRLVTPLDLSAACVQRDGPTAVAYFGGSTAPTQWHCAHTDDDGWVSQPISPQEGCRLMYGERSRAQRADSSSPFVWVCRG